MSRFVRLSDAARAVLAAPDDGFDAAATEALVALRHFVGGNGIHFVIDERVFHGHPSLPTSPPGAEHGHAVVGTDVLRTYVGHEPIPAMHCIVDLFAADPRWQHLVDVAVPTVYTTDSAIFPELRDRLVAGEVRSMMVVPFHYRGSRAGYFALFAKRDAFRLQPSDTAALSATCDAVGQSIMLRSHQMALDLSLRRYESLMEMSDECVFELDRRGHLTFVAPSWQRLVGRPGPDSLGMAFLDLAIEPGERLVRFLSAPRPGTSIRERVRLRAANGEVRAVEILLQHRTSDEFATAVEGCLRTVDGAPPEPAARRDVLDRLTSKEQEIVLLLLEGHRVRGIASQLFLSQHTVRNHLKRIFRKLGVSSQGELVARCRAGG
ncbi:MAG: hypothetical protein KDB40_01535 [Acidimicrobiales bacterium]|nr:hypothetical protein [Acidimicrobiales bacterium]